MVRRLGIPLAISALVALAGGHWVLLQVVAWAGMAVTYSQSFGWSEGLARTFSGEAPCSLCLKIEEGRGKEDRQGPVHRLNLVKLEAVAGRVLVLPERLPDVTVEWIGFCPRLTGRGLPGPELPPPRVA
ncbi:MAG: hypothetical protein OHK005_14730 [Candidatus Methylacidiphilales bacterium]